MDKLQEDFEDDEIEWTDKQKNMKAVKEMYECNLFDQRDLRDWEKKDDGEKTWVHLQSYFTALYNDTRRYNQASGKAHGYESAANVTERKEQEGRDEHWQQQLGEIAVAATADKEHIQQMTMATEDLLKIVKQQQSDHKEQMAAMKTKDEQIANLIEQNSKLVSTLSKMKVSTDAAADKGRARPAANQAGGKQQPRCSEAELKRRGKDDWCGLCGRHKKTNECFELEINAHKRPAGWVSLFA